jgi:hypothetical protein
VSDFPRKALAVYMVVVPPVHARTHASGMSEAQVFSLLQEL